MVQPTDLLTYLPQAVRCQAAVPSLTSRPYRARSTNRAVSALPQYAKWLLIADSQGFSTLPVCAQGWLSGHAEPFRQIRHTRTQEAQMHGCQAGTGWPKGGSPPAA